MYINKGSKHWEAGGERGRGVITEFINRHARRGNYLYQRQTPEKNQESLWFCIHTYVRSLWIKWDAPTILNGVRGREKCRPTYAACLLLACQPPTDLAINLQYKRSVISGSLILKWIIIWLHQSSLLNVKCLQFVKWPPFQPRSEAHVQNLSGEQHP